MELYKPNLSLYNILSYIETKDGATYKELKEHFHTNSEWEYVLEEKLRLLTDEGYIFPIGTENPTYIVTDKGLYELERHRMKVISWSLIRK